MDNPTKTTADLLYLIGTINDKELINELYYFALGRKSKVNDLDTDPMWKIDSQDCGHD